MFTCQARSEASAAEAWELLARPDRWHEWAPHVRGAWGLGEPEVEEGRRGYARLMGVLPVPARITEVTAGSSWTWKVGPATMAHRVEPRGEGCLVVGLFLEGHGCVQARQGLVRGDADDVEEGLPCLRPEAVGGEGKGERRAAGGVARGISDE